ncbi:PSD1 and planctomycete cytochrome C domain-containing protein [Thalassoglobus sp. JC818]|uniref:PSD1 and planctomycete cytochrome C domain-containing protein n=1 Tax=Thalassoglobus sp. JC818 TaxID=3232136 RepID=UPI00345A7057
MVVRNFWNRMTLAVASLLLLTGILSADVPAEKHEEAARLFTLKVLPTLKAKCFGCHGDDPENIKGELDVRTLEGLLRGGESGEPSIVVGHPEESSLVSAIKWELLEMPPKENDRLTDKQIEQVEEWIRFGAPWPSLEEQRRIRDEEAKVIENEDGVIVSTSGGLSDEWTTRRYAPDDLWAFRPLAEVTVPEDQHPVDYFIQRKLKDAGFASADQADPETLIRRATLDLIGLAPTPQETAQFKQEWREDSEQAWSNLIDRLLESPHYGERWGQHWLDVVRYADTGGYANDYERSNAWRYRDYVIRSFNNDKPYNQFVVEQLAGDELADASVRERTGVDEKGLHQVRLNGDYTQEESEWLVATGFLRMGPWDNAMVLQPEARQIYLDDLVNSVGQSFLSTTMRCFKCHDHKFDPLPTRDYYRMYAAFAGTQMAERPVPFLDTETRNGFEEGKLHVEKMLKFATAEKDRILAKQEAAAKAWFDERGLKYLTPEERKELPDEEKPPRHVGLDHVDEGQLKVREQDEWIWTRRLERYEPMVQSVFNASDEDVGNRFARKLRLKNKVDPGLVPTSTILLGGGLSAPGDEVAPGVLSAVGLEANTASSMDPFLLDSQLEGRRLGLAKWIVHPDNALAVRSIVNRIWQHHFAKPIAANPNNFGAKGGRPTHPELLDWLASEFVLRGWSFKEMHRLLMSSETYRQASFHPQVEELETNDPNNDLYAYANSRRLTAEEIRDSMLAITGELNPEVGGLPVMPEMNMEVALQPRMIQFSLAPAYQPSRTPAMRNRRTIYAYRVRGQADPFLELFNQPNPNDSCEARDSAAVTPQAFTLLNSDMMIDRSIALALRLHRENDSIEGQVRQAFELCYGRKATSEDVEQMVGYVSAMQDYHQQVEPQPAEYPTEITRSLVEEFSGQPFEYQEVLPVFERYQSDPKAADVDVNVRALADMCLLLLNSNEFLFVY